MEVNIYDKDEATQLTSVYFHGKGCAEIGAYYRRMTLKNKDENVENLVNENNEQGEQVKDVKYNDLNFKYNDKYNDKDKTYIAVDDFFSEVKKGGC